MTEHKYHEEKLRWARNAISGGYYADPVAVLDAYGVDKLERKLAIAMEVVLAAAAFDAGPGLPGGRLSEALKVARKEFNLGREE